MRRMRGASSRGGGDWEDQEGYGRSGGQRGGMSSRGGYRGDDRGYDERGASEYSRQTGGDYDDPPRWRGAERHFDRDRDMEHERGGGAGRRMEGGYAMERQRGSMEQRGYRMDADRCESCGAPVRGGRYDRDFEHSAPNWSGEPQGYGGYGMRDRYGERSGYGGGRYGRDEGETRRRGRSEEEYEDRERGHGRRGW